MATIESTLKEIAQEQFKDFSYVFDNWYDADAKLERLEYPAILCVMPTSGQTEIINGRIYDTEDVAIAFLDLAPRGAEGEDNEEVYTRMKVAGARFIQAINNSKQFDPIDRIDYSIICEQLATIVSGVMYTMKLTQRIGVCDHG